MQQSIESPETRKPRKTRLKSVWVARSLEKDQLELESFFGYVKDVIGHVATIYTLEDTQLTLLEAGNVRSLIRKEGHYERGEVGRLASELNSKFPQHGHGQLKVALNMARPLRYMGKFKDRLALNLIPHPELIEERSRIENVFKARFDETPNFTELEPHVTFGHVHKTKEMKYFQDNEQVSAKILSEHELANPNAMFGDEIYDFLPEEIALNGLRVYLGDRSLERIST